MKMTNIWCMRLGIPQLAGLWLRGLFVPTHIYYFEHQVPSLSRLLLDAMQSIGLCSCFKPAGIDFNRKDVEGRGLVYRENALLVSCMEASIAKYLNFSDDDRYRQMAKAYMRGHLEGQAYFITGVESEIRFRFMQDDTNIIWLESNLLNGVLLENYGSTGIILENTVNFSKAFRQFLVPWFYLAEYVRVRIFPQKIKTSLETVRPSVWVEYSDNERDEHAFWREYVSQENFDVVYYLDRSDTPVTMDRTSMIRARRVHWIDAHLQSMLQLSNLDLGNVARLFLRYLWPAVTTPMWLRIFSFQERLWQLVYTAVFQKFQVKILFQHQDRGWRQAVQAEAMELVGGVMIGYHWSNLPYCMNSWYLTSQHVFFVWGASMRACQLSKGHTCHYIIPSGIWLNRTSKELPPVLNQLIRGHDFVISIYDSNTTNSLASFPVHTPATLALFFLRLLALLESNPRWGGIIKPKYRSIDDYTHILPDGNEIVDRMKTLIASGRLLILDHNISPIVASEHSDLTVCYCLNSAGIVAGIYGHKAIHWDCVGLESTYYKDPQQQFLFLSIDEFEHAILEASKGDENIGDFSKWRQTVNYFNDFEGASRIGWFVQIFMDEILTHGDSMTAMKTSVAKYAKQYNVESDICRPLTVKHP